MRLARYALAVMVMVFFLSPAFAADAPAAPPVMLAAPTPAAVPAAPAVAPAAPIAPAPAVVPPADPVAAPKPMDPDKVTAPEFLQLIVGAAKAGDWKLAVVMALVFLIWLTRKFGSKVPGPLGKFLASDPGGVIVAFLWAFLSTLGAVLTLGGKLDLHLVGEALLLSFTAMGGWVALKKLLPEAWKAKVPWLFGAAAPEPVPAPVAKP